MARTLLTFRVSFRKRTSKIYEGKRYIKHLNLAVEEFRKNMDQKEILEVEESNLGGITSWKAPQERWLKVNIDAFVKEGKVVVAMVVRDSLGKFIWLALDLIDCSSPCLAEVVALDWASTAVVDCNWKSLLGSSDAIEFIRWGILCFNARRPEGNNPLDLNNLPDDYTTRSDSKLVFEESSSGGYRRKKSGAKDGKDECGKVYECRFCSLKETETLNRARQLVFSNDNLAAQAPPHLSCCHPITPGGYHHPSAGNVGDPTIPLRFSTRMFSGSSSSLIPPPPPPAPPQPLQPTQPFLYTSPTRPMTFPSHHYPPHQHSVNDYYVGHVLSSSSGSSSGHRPGLNYGGAGAAETSSYTCIGAPVGHGFGSGGSSRGTDMVGISSGGVGRDSSLQEEGLNWGRSYSAGTSSSTQQRNLDPPASINRFQDGF
ncbi:hypothetical protein FNV43_RR26610 [Rhamnella rubrinervis]|uniref:Uncharacterized protein n=1 Tax=Rhamnella rubrinervis TaxID=2594499 RepID=A0A8K0GMN6_9ROSA|nr:hypothetical protein FNV43_RR26610 [Rhamnella rubrinervis]